MVRGGHRWCWRGAATRRGVRQTRASDCGATHFQAPRPGRSADPGASWPSAGHGAAEAHFGSPLLPLARRLARAPPRSPHTSAPRSTRAPGLFSKSRPAGEWCRRGDSEALAPRFRARWRRGSDAWSAPARRRPAPRPSRQASAHPAGTGHDNLSCSLRVDDPAEVLAMAFAFHEHPKRSQQPHRCVLLWPLVHAERVEGCLPDSFLVPGPRPGDQRGVRGEARYGDVDGVGRMNELVQVGAFAGCPHEASVSSVGEGSQAGPPR